MAHRVQPGRIRTGQVKHVGLFKIARVSLLDHTLRRVQPFC